MKDGKQKIEDTGPLTKKRMQTIDDDVATLKLELGSATANFNLGLLKAETGDKQSVEQYLRATLMADPGMSRAAYNLALLIFA
jgi:hypothetical protein